MQAVCVRSSWTVSAYAFRWGLLYYGPDIPALYRRAGSYHVDRILRGAKPADVPFEGPTVFELIVNRTTAQTLRSLPAPDPGYPPGSGASLVLDTRTLVLDSVPMNTNVEGLRCDKCWATVRALYVGRYRGWVCRWCWAWEFGDTPEARLQKPALSVERIWGVIRR